MKHLLKRSDLHDYQRAGYDHVIENPYAGLFLDMGLGKTVTSQTVVSDLIEDFEIENALVVAPKKVVDMVWEDEAKKWEHLRHLKFSSITGTPRQRAIALNKKADIYLISRDNIAWLCGLFGGGMLPYDMLIIDESSSFKNHQSVRFKALKKVQASFARVLILTGTPAPNGLIDLWSQIFLLDRGERLGNTITKYRKDFFYEAQKSGHIVYKYKLQKGSSVKIKDKIGDICISMKAKDYLDLPEAVVTNVKVHMSEDEKVRYKRFEKEKVLEAFSDEFDDDITALNAAGLSNKLQQFANGAVYDDEKNWHVVHTAKLRALEELVEDLDGKPLLVATSFKFDQAMILEHFKSLKPRILKTVKDRDDWNNGEIKMLLMHPASGGHGVNLQDGGSDVIWYGNTWALELYEQLNARLDRQGQKYTVNIRRLVCVGTVDEKIVKSQGDKSEVQNNIMEMVKALRNKYT